MKTLSLSIFALLATAVPALAQSRPAATSKPATSTAKPATTASKPATTAKPATASKPSATSKPAAAPATTSKPAATPQPAPTAKAAPAKPSKSTTTSSANETFGKGSTAANLGIGFGLGYSYGFFTTTHSIPALSLSVERGVTDQVGPGVIGVGGLVGFRSYSWKSGSYKGSWNNYLVAVRGTYHYNLFEVPKLDTYAGLSVGVRVESYSDNWSDNYYSSSYGGTYLTSGIFLGARYMFTDKLGAFGELGYDMSLLKVGVTAKF